MRSNFGGADTGALAIQAPAGNSGVVKSAPLITTGTAWSAATGGTQYTDMLLVGGGASAVVLTDSNGFVRAFQGPDGVNEGLWVDLGSGRFYLRTTDALSSTYGRSAQSTFRAGRQWLFAGDSITNGSVTTNSAYAYPTQALHMAGTFNASPDGIEAGTAGYRSDQLLAYLPTLLALNPGAVHIQIGTNDTGNAVPLATYQTNMAAMVALIKAKGIPVTIGTIPPRGPASATAPIRSAIAAYNTWLRLWAPSQGVELAEVHAALADTITGDYTAAYDSGDGVHPNDLGHQKIAMAVAAAMLRVNPTTQRGAIFTANPSNLATNPLMVTAGTDPTGSTANTATGTAPVHSIIADTTGVLPAGAWAQLDLNAAAASVYARNLPVSATGWAVGDNLMLCAYMQIVDLTGTWPALVAAGTADIRITARNVTASTTLRASNDRCAGRPAGAGVYNIGPVFIPFTVPTGCLAIDMPYSVTAPTGLHIQARFGCVGLLNMTALGLPPGGAGMSHYDGP